ncbi:TetR/AcrR family transcriptional regulator [Gudongella oleilytica]|jgi:AcrR family transcriptional regulator|uniref:TetR/AcrR family transcriptional regulator n=1 Tax=Gudongella oleilytica TaxID=1582259 RepID=UPI002A36FA3B|nr:TetR/AcrR family transcriptional regulator [Gudongella oleilytica]MDY0256203.1 TetR/AcrR family transcriptional regulator [Gudongella oleilytica]
MAKFTKKAIVDTFVKLLNEKPLSKITVKEITEECEINRNTFYYYFEDIYTLVDYLFCTELQKLQEITDTSDTLSDECEIVLDLLKNNRTALKHVYESSNRNQLERYLFKALDKAMIDFMKQCFKEIDVSGDDIQFLARYHKYALVGFIIDWLANENDEDLVSLLKRISILSEESIRNYLKNSVEIFRQYRKFV